MCALAAMLTASAFCEDITPHISAVQVFGLRKVSAEKISSALDLKPGDSLPPREQAEARIAKVQGVVRSSVEAVCCFERGMVLYVGIEEKNSPHTEFHPAPTGDDAIPQDLAAIYDSVLEATAASMRSHNADEDLTNGYSLLADPKGRAEQEQLLPLVEKNMPLIDKVVHNSADPDQRAMAAYLLQYAPRNPREVKMMSDDLQYALQDPDTSVRGSAMLALKAVLVGARLHHQQHIHIEPTWFVELMNSTQWDDRRNASLALVTLTDKADPDALSLIRERALDSVLDMAAWTDLEHALPGFILAGRLAGMSQQQIEHAWDSGDRSGVIEAAKKTAKKASTD